ncbi:MAG: discoidin domain-containing protein, partial [Treponema sp.]|nr:discoidin domain-containing protein [Treponema sp.]
DYAGPFDSLSGDNTLYYTLSPSNSTPPEDTQEYQVYEDDSKPPALPSADSEQKPGNLAYNKPVSASSVEAAYTNYPEKAVDGNMSTRWSSEWNIDPSWITVDLETKTTINRVNISWESSYAKEYEIQVSDNGTDWTTVYHTGAGKGGQETVSFTQAAARYVRIYCMQRALQWGYSIYEIEVYAP